MMDVIRCGPGLLGRSFLAAVLALATAACGSSAVSESGPDSGTPVADAGDAGAAPNGHTLVLGGIAHRPGNTNPLHECVECHGSDLKGDVGPSCYTCHDNSDHTSSRGGVQHKSGSSSTCSSCHGPSNSGGLGPACTKCH